MTITEAINRNGKKYHLQPRRGGETLKMWYHTFLHSRVSWFPMCAFVFIYFSFWKLNFLACCTSAIWAGQLRNCKCKLQRHNRNILQCCSLGRFKDTPFRLDTLTLFCLQNTVCMFTAIRAASFRAALREIEITLRMLLSKSLLSQTTFSLAPECLAEHAASTLPDWVRCKTWEERLPGEHLIRFGSVFRNAALHLISWSSGPHTVHSGSGISVSLSCTDNVTKQ